MVIKLKRRVCLECSTVWGVDEKAETTAALHSLASTTNAIGSSGTQRTMGQIGAMQGLQAQEAARTCPNCHAKNFREEEYFVEEGVVDEKVPTAKNCPDCAEEVKIAAKKCKHCGHEFSDDEVETAITNVENAQRKAEQRQQDLRSLFLEQEKQGNLGRASGIALFVCIIAEIIGLLIFSSMIMGLNSTVGTVLLIVGIIAIFATAKKQRRWIESNARKNLSKKDTRTKS